MVIVKYLILNERKIPIENLPEERKLAIEQKKKVMVAEIQLREAIESNIGNSDLEI
jgi:hypothetical protein